MDIYFAGMGLLRNLKMGVEVGATCFSASFHQLCQRPGWMEYVQSLREERPDLKFFCDSGAFAFKDKPEEDVRAYFQELLEFYRQWWHLFDVLAEFDAGTEAERTGFRKRLEDAAGCQVLPVWAVGQDSADYADGLLEEYDYVGLGKGDLDVYRRGIAGARKVGARCHGRGVGKPEVLRQADLYSVDSATWTAGSRYGYTFIFRHEKMEVWTNREKHRRPWLRKVFDERELDYYDDFVADDHEAVDRWNLSQWVAYARWLDERQKERGPYWEREDPECTCGSAETRGACKLHGLGLSGNPPPIQKGDMQTEETKKKVSLSRIGNVWAAVHGKATPRLPQLRCDDCHLSAKQCHRYQEGAACQFDEEFQGLAEELGSRNWEGLVKFLTLKMQIDSVRYLRAVRFEAADGGLIDKGVQSASAQTSSDVKLLARLLGVMQPEGLKTMIDARQVQIIAGQMSDEALDKLLDTIGIIREVAPQLLDGSEE